MKKIASIGLDYLENKDGKLVIEMRSDTGFAELNCKVKIGEIQATIEKLIEKDGKDEGTITIYLKPINLNYKIHD